MTRRWSASLQPKEILAILAPPPRELEASLNSQGESMRLLEESLLMHRIS